MRSSLPLESTLFVSEKNSNNSLLALSRIWLKECFALNSLFQSLSFRAAYTAWIIVWCVCNYHRQKLHITRIQINVHPIIMSTLQRRYMTHCHSHFSAPFFSSKPFIQPLSSKHNHILSSCMAFDVAAFIIIYNQYGSTLNMVQFLDICC